jgi:hypothetical protein
MEKLDIYNSTVTFAVWANDLCSRLTEKSLEYMVVQDYDNVFILWQDSVIEYAMLSALSHLGLKSDSIAMVKDGNGKSLMSSYTLSMMVDKSASEVHVNPVDSLPEMVITEYRQDEAQTSPDSYSVQIGALNMYMSVELWKRFAADDRDQTAELFTRYMNMGLNSRYSVCLGSQVYRWFEENSDLTVLECFASPMDRTLDNYCSIYNDDKDQGSKGECLSYMNSLDQPMLLVAHPPDIEVLVELFIKQMSSYIRRNPGSGIVLFLSSPNAKADSMVKMGRSIRHIKSDYYIYVFGTAPNLKGLVG